LRNEAKLAHLDETKPMSPLAFSDDTTPLARLKALVRDFSVERDWVQFHHPKDLGVALACEVGELLEHFRYRRDDEIRAWLDDPANRGLVADEVADCLWLLLRLADVVGFDLASALAEKVEAAGQKYPVELVKGRADKYTAYRGSIESKSE
jgi:dCTP diphosphatase